MLLHKLGISRKLIIIFLTESFYRDQIEIGNEIFYLVQFLVLNNILNKLHLLAIAHPTNHLIFGRPFGLQTTNISFKFSGGQDFNVNNHYLH